MAGITVNNLTKRYKNVTAVDDLSFQVESGKVTGFLGRNGAGKTTTLRMILGLVRPTSGLAVVDGKPYAELPSAGGTVGAVLEHSGFHPGRSARNHLEWVGQAIGLPSGSRTDELLDLVGLTEAADRRVGQFSLGMRQRLVLATALVGDPELLILDEPANGLDPQGVRWLREFVRGFAASGRTVLLSSHVLAEVAQTVDHVIVIERGRLVMQGPVDELTAGGVIRVRTPKVSELVSLVEGAGSRIQRREDEILFVEGLSAAEVADMAAGAGIPIYELAEERESLEELFLRLTSEGGIV